MSDSANKNQYLRNLFISWPEKAFRHLYERYYDSMIRVAEWRTRDLKASEDIVQEAFIDIWENRERIAKIKDLQLIPYLFTIVKNKSAAFVNKTVKLNENQMKYITQELLLAKEPIEKEIISEEEKAVILKIISTFPERERQCLTLKFYHGMSNAAIAQNLNVTVKAVERSITSGYKRFRKYRGTLQ